MLVYFKSPAYAKITMFGDIAVKLLKLMGHSGTVPGALRAADVPAALEKLKAGLATEAANEPEPDPDEELDPNAEPRVGIAARGYPLVELLQAAAAAEADVMWDK